MTSFPLYQQERMLRLTQWLIQWSAASVSCSLTPLQSICCCWHHPDLVIKQLWDQYHQAFWKQKKICHFFLFSNGWLPKEAHYGIRYVPELDKEMLGDYMVRSREGDRDHQSWKRTLNQLSHNMKPLLKKLIIKDMLGGEGQCNKGTKCSLIFICYSQCSFAHFHVAPC